MAVDKIAIIGEDLFRLGFVGGEENLAFGRNNKVCHSIEPQFVLQTHLEFYWLVGLQLLSLPHHSAQLGLNRRPHSIH